MYINKFKLLALALSVSILAACESDPSDDLQDSIVESTETSNFDLAESVIPFPNDLLFAGSADGTLNIPVADAADLADPQVALNGLDGFSTVAPMTTGFTGEIDEDSLSGKSIKLYEVTLSSNPQPGGAAVAIGDELTYGVDYVGAVSSVDSSGESLAILPLKPLNPSSAYYVVITNKLKSADGNNMGVSTSYALVKVETPIVDGNGVSQVPTLTDAEAAQLEPVRQLISTSEATLGAFDSDLDTGDIILSWLFSTQSIGNVLVNERGQIVGGAIPASNLPIDTGDSPLAQANIWVGSLDVPYYLTAAASANDPTPLGTFWTGVGGSNLSRFNPDAVTTSTQTIPLMVSVPKSAEPAGGYPIVVYQHGITTNRATMLAVADAFALAGMAVAAIDLPMHGLTGNETDGTQAFYNLGGGNERTFDLDLVNNTTSAAGPDSVTDTSGKHFVNLTNLLNTRDNLRQAVTDLFTLTYAVGGMSPGGASFDTDRIYFLGHSLGAIVGTTFAALEPNVRDAAFAFGGGMLPKILDGSTSFAPTIVAGLESNGVIKGTEDYESFLGAAQTVVDSGDPINYASDLTTKTQGILYFEIQGSNASPSDLVVPNTVPDGNDTSGLTVPAPLAGTEPMIQLLGLAQVNSDQTGANLKHSVKFAVGNHGSLLSADADAANSAATNAAVRAEIQTLAATFLASDGAVVDVTDPDLLNAP